MKLKKNLEGVINYENITWTKKELNNLFNIGDVIYVKKVKDKENEYELKQLPKVNGGIVVMDPYTGRVLDCLKCLDSV